MGGGTAPQRRRATLYKPAGGSTPSSDWRRVVGGGGWSVFIQRELMRLLSVQELSVVLVLVCVRLLLLFVFYA